MAESVDSLKKILNEQVRTYVDLADSLRTQQQLVSEGRFDELSKNLEQEIALIARGKYLEQARIELMWEMADRGEIPRDNLTLPELIEHIGPNAADGLHGVRSRLRVAVDDLRELNARTADLLRLSMQAIEQMRMRTFGSNGQSYTPGGIAARYEKTSLVDRHG